MSEFTLIHANELGNPSGTVALLKFQLQKQQSTARMQSQNERKYAPLLFKFARVLINLFLKLHIQAFIFLDNRNYTWCNSQRAHSEMLSSSCTVDANVFNKLSSL